MKKFASALAVAAVLAAPAVASAQNQGPVVYGKMHLSVDYQDNENDSGTNISSNATRFGIKGTEGLGIAGWAAVYQIEAELNLDNSASANLTTGAVTSTPIGQWRDTYAGLKTNFGLLRLGRFVSPSTVIRARTDLFADQVGDARSALLSPVFDGRWNNSAAFSTKLGPVGVDLHYSTNFAGATTENGDDALYGAGLSYVAGPVFVGATYEKHEKKFGPANNSLADTDSFRLGASVTLGALRLTALGQIASDVPVFDVTSSTFKPTDSWTAGVGAAFTMGSTTLKGQYYHLDVDANDRNSDLFAVGVDQRLGKNTVVYLNYALVQNDSNTANNPWSHSHGDSINPAVGTPNFPTILGNDMQSVSLGIIHDF